MKKNTSSISKSPAPAKKPALAAKPTKPIVKKKAPPAVKPVATTPVVTTITAEIDIGFGNTLYLRGDGPGLSWDKGILMTCATDSQWQYVVGESARPITFKFLVNDLSWNVGPDYVAQPGSKVTLTPTF